MDSLGSGGQDDAITSPFPTLTAPLYAARGPAWGESVHMTVITGYYFCSRLRHVLLPLSHMLQQINTWILEMEKIKAMCVMCGLCLFVFLHKYVMHFCDILLLFN